MRSGVSGALPKSASACGAKSGVGPTQPKARPCLVRPPRDGAADETDVDGAALADLVPACGWIVRDAHARDQFVRGKFRLAISSEKRADIDPARAARGAGQLDVAAHGEQCHASVTRRRRRHEVAADRAHVADRGPRHGERRLAQRPEVAASELGEGRARAHDVVVALPVHRTQHGDPRKVDERLRMERAVIEGDGDIGGAVDHGGRRMVRSQAQGFLKIAGLVKHGVTRLVDGPG